MINFEKIEKIIIKYKLKPASQREMPLYTLSCIFLGYTKYLGKMLGYSYRTVGAVGGDGRFHTIFNEFYIAEKTENFIKKNYKNFDKIVFFPVKKLFRKYEIKLSVLKVKKIDPKIGLGIINDFYARYMACIGVYNCFWRYLGNNKSKGKLTEKDVKKISSERNKISKFYPKVEKLIRDFTTQIGKAEGFDGDLLRYLTYLEMAEYLNGRIKIKEMISTLSLRRKKYFYLLIEKNNYENIVTNKNIINKIIKKFYPVKDRVNEIKGYAAFKGVVRGIVYNLQNYKLKDSLKMPKNCILVTSMTHPDNINLIKQCVAIITDEGGILSHAAIVAREMKKPCIIGTRIATKVLHDGDLVEVDADKGIVKILNN